VLTLNDDIVTDILTVLFHAPQMHMQRNKIRDQLFPTCQKQYVEGSFDVVLQRRLDKLSRFVEKEYVKRSAMYSIRKETKDEVEKLLKEHDIHLQVSSLDTKWLNPLRNLFIRMKKEDPNRALDTYCFTFIGDIASGFSSKE
jgi:hypothetical protein